MWTVALLVAGTLAVPSAAPPAGRFDLQAHRGGLGLRVENTLASFGNALQLGVSTLELDVQITEDGQAVVTHDRRVSAAKCADTAPATAGDPEFPYAGKYVNTLTLAQVRTLDCGSRTLADRPGQLAVPGARMPLLSEVFALVKRYRADGVTLNVETKVEAGAPSETAPREQFVRVTAAEIRRAGLLRQVTVQSFDWGALRHAHANGIKVVPWTGNDLPTLGKLIDDGVDGIITDYPDRLRSLLAQRGFKTPQRYGSPLDIQAEVESRTAAIRCRPAHSGPWMSCHHPRRRTPAAPGTAVTWSRTVPTTRRPPSD